MSDTLLLGIISVVFQSGILFVMLRQQQQLFRRWAERDQVLFEFAKLSKSESVNDYLMAAPLAEAQKEQLEREKEQEGLIESWRKKISDPEEIIQNPHLRGDI